MVLLFQSIRCLLRSAPQLGVSRRFFCVANCLAQGSRKWTKAELQPLIEWESETESIYGPVINSKQNKSQEKKPAEPKVKKSAEKKPAEPKLKKSTGKSPQASNGTKAVKDVEILMKTSKFVEDTAVRIVKHTKVAAFHDTMDYEEVSEPPLTASSQKATKFIPTSATTLEPVEVSPASVSQNDSKNGRSNLLHTPDLSSTPSKPEYASGSIGVNDSETSGTGGFLSSILSFPPFTIAWNVTDGRRSVASAVRNATDVEPALKGTGFPSVSAILKATMPPESRFFLDRWEKEMIEELGEDGFQKYKQELFSNGSNLHLCIQKYLEGQSDIDLKKPNQGHWTSLEPVLNDVTNVACTEKPVKHPVLRYKGILDCVANYRGKTCVIDWKTSKKPKPNIRQTFDNPVQLAAYLGAYNSQPTLQEEVDSCLLVIGYQDGSPASVHQISRTDCLRYWQTWQRRVHLYWSDYFQRNLTTTGNH